MTGLHALQARAYTHVVPLTDGQDVADNVLAAIGLEEWPALPVVADQPAEVRDLITAYLVVRENLARHGVDVADLLADARHTTIIGLLAGILDVEPTDLATRLDAHALVTVLPTMTDLLHQATEEKRRQSVRSQLLAPLEQPARRP